jgi:hypothetical protein
MIEVPATSNRQVPVFANIDPSTSSTAFDDVELDMDLYMSVGLVLLVDDVGREEDEDNEPFIDGDDDDNDVEDSDD